MRCFLDGISSDFSIEDVDDTSLMSEKKSDRGEPSETLLYSNHRIGVGLQKLRRANSC